MDHTEESIKYEGDRRAFERALESMNDVNREVAAIIQSVWERDTDRADDAAPLPVRIVSHAAHV